MSKFDRQYQETLARILEQEPELNRRTGHAVRALAGVTLEVDLEEDGFPLLSLRKLPMSFVPEVMWMLSGEKSTDWLRQHTKIWDAFTEDDGTVEAAYGFRMRHAFGVDQLSEAMRKLSEDQSTRHAVVMLWDPADDVEHPKKNVPCPVMFTLNVIRGRLNMHLVIRSNDMVLGHPTDVAGFSLMAYMLAKQLGVMPGKLTVSISNAHVYENQVDVARELLSRDSRTDEVRLILPKDAYSRACGKDPALVQELKKAFVGYFPEEAIKDIPIAL